MIVGANQITQLVEALARVSFGSRHDPTTLPSTRGVMPGRTAFDFHRHICAAEFQAVNPSTMSKMLDISSVQKVAELARLSLTEDEIRAIAGQLKAVLENFEQIAGVNTKGVEPLITPTELVVHFREDLVVVQSDPDAFLANAPARSGRLFKVPPVV